MIDTSSKPSQEKESEEVKKEDDAIIVPVIEE